MKTFGSNLRNERKMMGLSQYELAKIMHVCQSTITNWENNHSRPSIDEVITILKVFDITFEDLIDGI